MPVTIRDVARKLNISITTVSRALDGYDDVAEETRCRVVEAAQELGYFPNRAARQLRRRRADTIGFALPSEAAGFSDPFFTEMISGLGDEAAVHNLDLLIATASPAAEDEQVIYQRWAHARKVDGCILNRMRLHDWRVQYLAGQRVPFVTLERTLDAVAYPSIEVDGLDSTRALVDLLVQKGHRRIAFVGASPDLVIHTDRCTGYREGLQSAGISFQPDWVVEGDLTRRGGYQAGQRLLNLPTPPTAVMCINDFTAFGVMHAAQDLGLQVGRDLAVTGFDGLEESESTRPPLTTIDQPVYDISRQLVRMLVAQINGIPLEQPNVRIPPRLVVRESTG